MPKSLVVIPTYNEAENIVELIQQIFALNDTFDVLIVDDNSPDGTALLVKDIIPRYPERLFIIERVEKLGLGTAYVMGFRFALDKGYDFIFEMDADFSHNPTDLSRLLKACIQDNYDLAIGSRYCNGVNVVNWPMGRVLMSYFAGIYVRFITGMPIMDPTAGFICFKRQVLETILMEKIKFVGYAFQIELKFLAWKYGFRIIEIPIIFTERQRGVSKMSVKIFKEAFVGVITMKVNSLFRKYIPPQNSQCHEKF